MSARKILIYVFIALLSLSVAAQDDNTRRRRPANTGQGDVRTNAANGQTTPARPQRPLNSGAQNGAPAGLQQQRRNNNAANGQGEGNRQSGTQNRQPDGQNAKNANGQAPKAQPKKIAVEDEEIPDSLLHPRWPIQRTAPLTHGDLDRLPADLTFPENIKQEVEYDDSLNVYIIGSKIGDNYLNTPVWMTPEEYQQWSLKREVSRFFREKVSSDIEKKGKDKFDVLDMHFDLGPAEKVFGPGGVRVKTQGSAELKLGGTIKNIENPSLPIRNRKTVSMDFDEKINLSVNGKVGDKMNMNFNYNTDATFDFDTQNLKLKYEGKEDEIIKLLEGGNVSFPSNNSLVTGASSLFGLRTDLQFGKLKLQTVISQKKSSSKSVSTKGGTQFTPFDINVSDYEENRHFFLAHYFRNSYDRAMSTLPNLATGVTITRVEVWVTNKTGNTSNTRNIVAFTDLGENQKLANSRWHTDDTRPVPSNASNDEYAQMTTTYAAARDVNAASTTLDAIAGFEGGSDYEKLESARLLAASEYTVNKALGYITLKSALQTDQVLAVAFEYTYGGVTYQVGEFASDNTNTSECLYVKTLKNTSNNPRQANWDLMMKNVYYLANNVEKEKFRLDIKYQSDSAGVYISYLPDSRVKGVTLLKALGCDRLDNNGKPHPNGYFDYVQGYTVSDGRVFLPAAEPFGEYMERWLTSNNLSRDEALKYCFYELYDSTKTVAKQIAEKNKYELVGQFKGQLANVISLGAYNVPQGSVVVTAGGVTLTENSDYTVDYSAGEVTIINQSIIDAGTNVNVSLESNNDYGMQRKTMLGVNWEYDFSKNFQIGGTLMHLSEQTLTTKVAMGEEPLKNTIWGLNMNWKKESQWLTNMLDKIPFLHLTAPSQISFNGEFAQLIAGTAKGTQDNASYIDDFENTKNPLDISTPAAWTMASTPTDFDEYKDKTGLTSSYNRALLAWYSVDPLFTRRSSSLTPSHIKSDLNQLSNHYVREVYIHELFPNKDMSNYSGTTSTLPILNLAYYPNERGAYNFDPVLNPDGSLPQPEKRWGGMMRKLETSDFETANIEYIEFWMLDPFLYSSKEADADEYGGDFYINLGEVSEDILRDGKKFYESGMPVDGSPSYTTTQWGKIPTQATVTYAFATTAGSRELQDVGFNGLTDQEEQAFQTYQPFLNAARTTITNQEKLDSILADPANDNYHYFRGADFDQRQTSILDRYKRINMPQGNSPDNEGRNESYDTSYKTTPDVEDINQDYTLNEYERYYQYHVSIRPKDMEVGKNYIVDSRTTTPSLRNGVNNESVTWYQFRIPVNDVNKEVKGSISDFSSIRFMRMFLTGFKRPVVLRFGTLELIKGEWRTYQQALTQSAETGTVQVSAVNIEENNDKTPVNYVLPPGISRVVDPSQPQLTQSNEQALDIVVDNLSNSEAKAVYKNQTKDIRNYKRIQMYVHANALKPNVTALEDNELSVFIRLGSDYKNNYYEYDIPLKLTPERTPKYNQYSLEDCWAVWPKENMLDIELAKFTALKKERNKAKTRGETTYSTLFSQYDADNPKNKISVMGNPSLGEVKTIVIGVRNNAATAKSGEVWVNELRLLESNNEGGWAAQGTLNIQLSDFGSVNAAGKIVTAGFGGLEQGITQRTTDNTKEYNITSNFELGKFFPEKAKVSIPLYYSVSKEIVKPKYNPLDTDMELDDALEALSGRERDSLESIAITKTTNRNFSISNARVGISTKRHPMPYDPANISLSYSHSHRYTSGETTVYEKEDQWRGALNYTYTPVYKPFEPFKKIKSKSKWLAIIKEFGLNWLPQNVAFNTEMSRNYYELQERDLESTENSQLPLTFSKQFLWNREFSIRWDFTKNLHVNFQSATNAEIEEPYAPVNKDLYPERYQAWKDSVWQSIKQWGRPLTYNQNFTASYQVPLSKIPIFDWIKSDASYTATYQWNRGTELEDGTSLGNTIVNNRTVNINGNLNLETLYNHIPFLEKTNKRFSKSGNSTARKNTTKMVKKVDDRKKTLSGKDNKQANDKDGAKTSKSFVKEITLKPDTTLTITHGKNSKRLTVYAKTADGKYYDLKYKVLDENKILIKNQDTVPIKLTVTPKKPLEEMGWYKAAQVVARVLMSVRSASISFRDNYSMTLPGFMPEIGKMFGQRRGDIMAPGLDFAFGMVGESYLNKAMDNGWMLMSDSIATPAAINHTQDLQLKMTLEPFRDFKIDLNASRTRTRAKTVQFMYENLPTTHSGTFTMTTISIGSAFEGTGSADNGYYSRTFEKFCQSLDSWQQRVEASYAGAPYPKANTLYGNKFDPDNGTVNKYSADVMVPAFLAAYTSGSSKSLDIFPTIKRLLPNWTIRYSGLGKLPWLSEHFKSVNINHSYKSVFAVGSYSSFSSWMEYMGEKGFVNDATTGNPVPSSMYNISTVSINEAFSPLLGIDMTLNNNMTFKVEYKTTRVLNLSMSSVQVNETSSKDWVVGMGYKIADFKLFGSGTSKKKAPANKKNGSKNNDNNKNNSSTSRNNSSGKGMNHELNLRADFSLRNQAAITRDIATITSAASSGNKALKISFSMEYTLSRLVSLTAYYDRQRNKPLLSSNSYPTTTQDFGISLKLSLTR